MNLQLMFRHEEHPAVKLTEEQIVEFYKKIVKMRGTLKRVHSTGGFYLGIRLSGSGEEWSIYREVISVIFIEEDSKALYFIDENREIELWLFEFLKSDLNSTDINIVTSDMDQVISYSNESRGECCYG